METNDSKEDDNFPHEPESTLEAEENEESSFGKPTKTL
jgi:hypothetical protein